MTQLVNAADWIKWSDALLARWHEDGAKPQFDFMLDVPDGIKGVPFETTFKLSNGQTFTANLVSVDTFNPPRLGRYAHVTGNVIWPRECVPVPRDVEWNPSLDAAVKAGVE